MKTTCFTLFVSIFFCLTSAYSQTEQNHPFQKVPLEKAIKNYQFVNAMYHQINPALIKEEQQGYYLATIKINKVTYIIFGRLEQWIKFFQMDPNGRSNSAIHTIPIFPY